MRGHAGFAYGFSVAKGAAVDGWFIRLPPPNIQWRGAADVLRQVAELNALDGTTVTRFPFEDDVMRWDRFHETAVDRVRIALVPEVRRRLLARLLTDFSVPIRS